MEGNLITVAELLKQAENLSLTERHELVKLLIESLFNEAVQESKTGAEFIAKLEELGPVDFNDMYLPRESVHLPTVNLIKKAYPHGIPHAHYLVLLSILAEEMSIRVLANVIAHIRGGHYTIYMNDVVDSMHMSSSETLTETVMEKLKTGGYDDWLAT